MYAIEVHMYNLSNVVLYYLFSDPQASSQIELENWINGMHSACASSFARQHGKENTLKLLRTEIQRLENSIDLVSDTDTIMGTL